VDFYKLNLFFEEILEKDFNKILQKNKKNNLLVLKNILNSKKKIK